MSSFRTSSSSMMKIPILQFIIILLRPECLVIVHGASLSGVTNTNCPKFNHPNLSCHPITIIVSFDGFRYNYMQKSGVSTPNLDALKSSGSWAAYLRNQFPTKTFPNHQSLATGLFPESHGVVDNSFYDPNYLRELQVQDKEFWVYRDDILPIWVVNQIVDPETRFSGSMMWPGSCHSYGGPLNGNGQGHTPTYCVDYKPSMSFSSRIDTALSWLTNLTTPANLLLLYFEEPDELAHAFGPESPEVLKAIKTVDNTTGYLVSQLKNLGLYEHVNILVLSDHGFVEVKQSHIINLDLPAYKINTSLFTQSGGSPTYQILPKNNYKDIVFNQLKEAQQTFTLNYSVYLKEELKSIKPHWQYSDNRRISPVFLIADLGYVFEDFLGPHGKMQYWDEKYNRTHIPSIVYGTHGYDNHYQLMHPFFIAHGPSFWSDGREVEPFDSVNIFNLMCKLLQVPDENIPQNNGTTTFNGKSPIEQLLLDMESRSGGIDAKESQRKKLQIVGFAVVGALVISTIISVYIFVSIGRDCLKKESQGSGMPRKSLRLQVSLSEKRKLTNGNTRAKSPLLDSSLDNIETKEEEASLLREFSLLSSSCDEEEDWENTEELFLPRKLETIL